MVNRTLLKKLITPLGSLLALISLLFVGQQLFDNWYKINVFKLNLESASVLLLGAIGYACSCFFLSSAWHQILISLCSKKLSTEKLRSIYARSQIAKYIPGNVMQIAGRHVMIRRLGVSHKPLAMASLIEIIGLLTASCTVTLVGSVVFGLSVNYVDQKQLYYGLAIIVLLLFLMPFIRMICLKYFPSSRLFFENTHFQLAFFFAYLKYLLFFIFAGSILLGLVYYISGSVNLYDISAIIATFAVSWLAGFITPGAPSGIGVRETILVMSLDKILLGSSGALIAILFRIVTIGGDILFFSIAGRKTLK